MLSKGYCTDVFSPFSSRFVTVNRVCQSLGLFQGSTDEGLDAFCDIYTMSVRSRAKKDMFQQQNIYRYILLLFFYLKILFVLLVGFYRIIK